MTENNEYLPYNLQLTTLVLAKKVTSNLPKLPQQKFGQTQQQILNF